MAWRWLGISAGGGNNLQQNAWKQPGDGKHDANNNAQHMLSVSHGNKQVM